MKTVNVLKVGAAAAFCTGALYVSEWLLGDARDQEIAEKIPAAFREQSSQFEHPVVESDGVVYQLIPAGEQKVRYDDQTTSYTYCGTFGAYRSELTAKGIRTASQPNELYDVYCRRDPKRTDWTQTITGAVSHRDYFQAVL